MFIDSVNHVLEVKWIVFFLQVPQAGLNDVPCKFVGGDVDSILSSGSTVRLKRCSLQICCFSSCNFRMYKYNKDFTSLHGRFFKAFSLC
jgi:hypothetical protein